MEVIYGLLPGMILLGLVSVVVFFLAVRHGQYEDMEGPAYRILDDDDMNPKVKSAAQKTTDVLKKPGAKPGKNEETGNRP